jgi:hypothetical protein
MRNKSRITYDYSGTNCYKVLIDGVAIGKVIKETRGHGKGKWYLITFPHMRYRTDFDLYETRSLAGRKLEEYYNAYLESSRSASSES